MTFDNHQFGTLNRQNIKEMIDKDEVVVWAEKQLRDLGDPIRAEKEKAYTKSPLCFYGVSKPEVNVLARDAKRRWQFETERCLLPVIEALWDSHFYEEKSFAIVLAALHQQLFGVEHLVDVFQRWLRQATSWGHVDELCIRVVGMIAIRDHEAFDVIAQWAGSKQLWVRRASLVAHLPTVRKDQPQLLHLEETCQKLADDKDFFIRKAIGWVLRELSERRPEETERILVAIGSRAAGLTIREAIRKMPEARRVRILQTIRTEPSVE